MNLEAELERIKQGKFAKVYFLYGEDEYPIQAVVRALKEKIASGPMAQFNLDELSGGSLSWSALLERANTLPMLSPVRLVIGWGVDKLMKKSEDDLEAAEAYVSNPLKETVLVLTATSADKRLRFITLLEKAGGALLEATHPKLHEVPGVIKRFAKAFGKDIDEEGARALADLVGAEMMWLRNEVDKLCLYVGGRPRITADDVRAVMADIGAHDVWALTDTLAQKDFAGSIRLLETLIRDEQPPMILGALARQFRTLSQVKLLQVARRSRDEIGRETRIPPFLLDKALGHAKSFTLAELAHVYRRLEATDIRLKRSSQPPRMVLESLIADICLSN